MLAKRIIPCLDVNHGRVVKGKQFHHLQDVDDPVALGKFYSHSGADELVFYDITATHEGRETFVDTVKAIAEELTIPFTVGGGIRKADDFRTMLLAGADKVSVNSAAVMHPEIIRESAERFGNQCVVLSIDGKRNGNGDCEHGQAELAPLLFTRGVVGTYPRLHGRHWFWPCGARARHGG